MKTFIKVYAVVVFTVLSAALLLFHLYLAAWYLGFVESIPGDVPEQGEPCD